MFLLTVFIIDVTRLLVNKVIYLQLKHLSIKNNWIMQLFLMIEL